MPTHYNMLKREIQMVRRAQASLAWIAGPASAPRDLTLCRVAWQAVGALKGLPDRPGRLDLLVSLDILGKVVQLASRRLDPLAPIIPFDAEDLRNVRASLGPKDPRTRVDILGMLAEEDPLDTCVIRAVAMVLQRDLLDMDPPEIAGARAPWSRT